MAIKTTAIASVMTEEIPIAPTELIYDDGVPMESNRHRIAMNILIDSVNLALSDHQDFFAGGNMFIYYSSEQLKNEDFKGHDFFVVLDTDGQKSRKSWVVWEENGRYPDVIIELMSPSTTNTDLGEKKRLYERTFKTLDYFVYNPFNAYSLQGWQLGITQKYEEIKPNEKGWLWCESLNLWLGSWSGVIQREYAPWLRFYDAEENLILLPEELAKKERERAEILAAKLRELGINPDQL